MAIRTANNQSLTEITAFPSAVALGGLVLLETQTASSDATISFTSNIDSTYKEYIFKFIDIHPEESEKEFGIQFNAAGGSGYNETITSTNIKVRHTENDVSTALGYNTAGDQAQGTAFQILSEDSGNDNDNCVAGTLHIFNPSSTTFVKHFICEIVEVGGGNAQLKNNFIAGYINTTSAIDEVQLKFSSGNIDSGTIKMYGVT